MRLKTIEFYQSVRLWTNKESKTIEEGNSYGVEDLTIELVDHLVMLNCSNFPGTIIVPTANMRHGRADTVGEILCAIDDLAGSIKENMEKANVKIFKSSCEGGCTYSRAMNQPTPRLCKKCNLPEEVKRFLMAQ